MAPTAARTSTRTVPTPGGPARVRLSRPGEPERGLVVLGHGAGGGVHRADLEAARDAAVAAGWAVATVEQPWLVAGRRIAPAPPRLDEAWVPTVAALRRGRGHVEGPLVVGGRSAGARVACRTAAATGAAGVLCLSFPLHPPGEPGKTRAGELAGAAAALPTVVVQGERDPFGTPVELHDAVPAVAVTAVPGDHAGATTTAAVEQLRGAVTGLLHQLA